MSELRCTCGEPVLLIMESIGLGYVTEFRHPITQREIVECPGCGINLLAANVRGDLAEARRNDRKN